VIDIHDLHEAVGRPVLVVARRPPRLDKIRKALDLLEDGDRKWAFIQRAGPMEAVGGLYLQRAGLTIGDAQDLLAATTIHGNLPEPLRLAHIIAGGIVTGRSRGRA
jgi:endonuclease V-like protein UPF0215 family